MKIMLKLNEELKTSFVFATHDEKIMGYLRRIIHLEDGKIIKDEKIKTGDNLKKYIKQLKLDMYREAEELNFEKAAKIRDEISKLEKNEINI